MISKLTTFQGVPHRVSPGMGQKQDYRKEHHPQLALRDNKERVEKDLILTENGQVYSEGVLLNHQDESVYVPRQLQLKVEVMNKS